MSISQYHNAIFKDLDILEKATRNDYIQTCLANIRQNVNELYDDARNYRDALAYINGITKNVADDMLAELTPADFKEAFSDVAIDDDNGEMIYNSDLLKEALDRGDISKDGNGTYYSNKKASEPLDEIKERLDKPQSVVDLEKEESKEEVLDEGSKSDFDFMDDSIDEDSIPDSVFDFEDDYEHYDFYDDVKALFQKQSPDRLAFLRSTREPTIEVRNDPIDVREIMEEKEAEEFSADLPDVDDVKENLDEEVEIEDEVGVSISDFIEELPEEMTLEDEYEELYDSDMFMTEEEMAQFDS